MILLRGERNGAQHTKKVRARQSRVETGVLVENEEMNRCEQCWEVRRDTILSNFDLQLKLTDNPGVLSASFSGVFVRFFYQKDYGFFSILGEHVRGCLYTWCFPLPCFPLPLALPRLPSERTG